MMPAKGVSRCIAVFANGVTELLDFGDERLVDAVVTHRDRPASELLNAVFERAREFTAGAFADDATLITVAIG